MEQNKLQIISVNAHLDQINYNCNNLPEKEGQVNVQQILSVLTCDSEKISIKMERKLLIGESNNPFLIVSAIGDFFLSSETKDNFENHDEMLEYANKRAGFLVDKIQMGAFLSQLIANITGTFANAPIVLPPIISDDNHNEEQKS